MNLKSEVRKEIELIIKENDIDRHSFFEVSKTKYQDIINKSFTKFLDSTKRNDFLLYKAYLRYNKKLQFVGINEVKYTGEWWQWFRLLPQLINEPKKYVYVIFSGMTYTWVYEGKVKEIIEILYRGTPIGEGDCYIISKKYDWLIGYSDDGDYVSCLGSGLNFETISEQKNLKIYTK